MGLVSKILKLAQTKTITTMVNIRLKQKPNRIYKVIGWQVEPEIVNYLGKTITIPKLVNICVKGVGFSEEKFVKMEEIFVGELDNPGFSKPVFSKNGCFMAKITKDGLVSMNFFIFAFPEPNKPKKYIDIIGNSQVIGLNTKSMDLVRDFAKRFKLDLIN